MKIKEIRIKNYRSLQDFVIENIGDLSTFIGSNSSGKSNLFEAISLFFSYLDASLEQDIGTADEYLWFDRDSSKDIIFQFGFEVEKTELKTIIPEDIVPDVHSISTPSLITVVRVIKGPASSAKWKTLEVSLNGNILVKDDKFVYKKEKIKKTTSKETTNQKVAPSAGNYLELILKNISQSFKGKFKLIPAVRNVVSEGGMSGRTSFISASLLSKLVKLGQAMGRHEEERWINLQESVTNTSLDIEDLLIRGSKVIIKEKGTYRYFPVELIGGGYQEMLELIYEITEDNIPCVAVEEPEAHFHPEITRKLFDFMKKESEKRQLFISTHSPVFIDQENLRNTWIVRKENRSTTTSRIKSPKELQNVLFELGIRPSDIFFYDAIIFVEGVSDKKVFQHWFRKAGVELSGYRVTMIPINGKAKGKYHLKVWLEAIRNVKIKFFMIFDKDAEKEAKDAIDTGVLKRDENLFLLEDTLEDYYDLDKLVKAINSEYNLKITAEKKKLLKRKPRSKSIDELLRKRDIDKQGWKVRIGEKVAKSMTFYELPEEIRRIIERIGTDLRI